MKISVAMAYYNGGTYIEEQMDSILSQLGEKDEVIVSFKDGRSGFPNSYCEGTGQGCCKEF